MLNTGTHRVRVQTRSIHEHSSGWFNASAGWLSSHSAPANCQEMSKWGLMWNVKEVFFIVKMRKKGLRALKNGWTWAMVSLRCDRFGTKRRETAKTSLLEHTKKMFKNRHRAWYWNVWSGTEETLFSLWRLRAKDTSAARWGREKKEGKFRKTTSDNEKVSGVAEKIN